MVWEDGAICHRWLGNCLNALDSGLSLSCTEFDEIDCWLRLVYSTQATFLFASSVSSDFRQKVVFAANVAHPLDESDALGEMSLT
jgi:hypothetical protein